tara:strand:+ start:272 stop:433 length:162 start_codon:yes stop_codon:yes gene_type:complete
MGSGHIGSNAGNTLSENFPRGSVFRRDRKYGGRRMKEVKKEVKKEDRRSLDEQ